MDEVLQSSFRGHVELYPGTVSRRAPMAYELKCLAPGPSRVTVFVCVCLFFKGETQF